MPVITCYNKEFVVPYDKENITSEYIKDIVTFSGDEHVVIPVQDKYCTVINNYVEFLTGEKQSLITSRDRLLLSFQLNTLFVDGSYFNYLVQQTFNNWSYMCNMVYNEFNDDLQWLFFVHCPHDFIPKYLLDNNSFMIQWDKVNWNTVIHVNNDNEIYYNNNEKFNNGIRDVTTYHTVNSKTKTQVENGSIVNYHAKEVGYKKITTYYKDSNNIASEHHYVDGKKDGDWKRWYNDDQHRLRYEEHYVDGKEDGVWRYWYDTQREINDQQTTGIPQGESLRHTEGGLRHIEDILKEKWLRCACRHTLEFEENYVDGKLDGTWRWWYNNDQHTLATEGQWVNGEKHGQWVEFDINGNITSDDVYVNGVKQY